MSHISSGMVPQYREHLAEICENCASGPYPEFVRKFYAQVDVSSTERVSKYLHEADLEKGDGLLLSKPSSKDLGMWLAALAALELPGQSGRWSTPGLIHGEAWMSGTSIAVMQQPDGNLDWRQAAAVCHAASNAETYQSALVHLYAFAKGVFSRQPLRAFIHGALIWNGLLELWVFDRSGMYAAEPVDLATDYMRAVALLLSYTLMKPENLGITQIPYVISATGILQINVLGEVFHLRHEPIVSRDGIFGDGLVCYLARKHDEQGWTHIVKYKWRNRFKKKEEDVLKTANDRCISGVPTLVHAEEMSTTAQLRAGLRHQPSRRLLDDGETLRDGYSLSKHSILTDSGFQNRSCMRLVFTPVGQPLSECRSTVELLSVIRDAVEAHRALLRDAHILHRDISDQNILIVPQTRKGLLIDFDVAMDLTTETPSGDSISGTLQFMAAGLMDGDPHTYRHDLESFFYVLLQVISCDKKEMPSTSRFMRWKDEDWVKSRDARVEDMARERFELLLCEWSEKYTEYKELAWTLWRLLFREADGKLFFGTDASVEGRDALYDGFIQALESTIGHLQPVYQV